MAHFFHQIITMADSGLDVNSCFFSEDQSEDNIECSTYTNPVFDLTKRKVCSTLGTRFLRPLKSGFVTDIIGIIRRTAIGYNCNVNT